MIVNSNKIKTLISGLWIFSFFIFISASACSTPPKKEAKGLDKVEATSTESAEHPSDSLSTETSGGEHPSDDAAKSEHPTDDASDAEHPK